MSVLAPDHPDYGAMLDAIDGEPLTCDLCAQPIQPGEPYTDDGAEIAHDACVSHWFRSSFGREALR